MTLRVAAPAGYEPERRYVLDVLLREFLGLEYTLEQSAAGDAVELSLGDRGDALRVPDLLFQTPTDEWLAERSLPRLPLSRKDGLPVVFGDEDGVIDVFGSAFFLLTRYEEIARPAHDAHDRFPAAASLGAAEGVLERPLVNEYVELLRGELASRWPRLETRKRTYRELPSHDVDWPLSRRTTLATVAPALVRDALLDRDPLLALDRVRAFVRRRRGDTDADLHNTFDFLMDESERRGLRSAFYFIVERTAGDLDGVHSIDDPWLRALLRRIHSRGHEIGLHPSYGTFRDPEQTRREFDRLRRVCEEEGIEQPEWGGRQHFLRWENPTTWQSWDDAGLTYDSTLGFPDRPGFRCGVCFEYPVFNLRSRRMLALRERPLVVMEQTVIDSPANRDDALARIEQLRTTCRRFGGDFTLLWHNSRLISRRDRALYAQAVAGAG